MFRKLSIVILAIFSTAVGLYPFIYFFVDRKFGLLQSKSAAILSSISWNTAFYTHIVFGGIALLIGWTQFVKKWRKKHLNLHRTIGKIYVSSVLLSALAGIYIALFASGGIIASIGFICLGLVWFSTTLKAYFNIRKGKVSEHRKMMVYSYAVCFAAVTLRTYLPILIIIFKDFNTAYPIVAWLCWIPNLFIAHFFFQKFNKQSRQTVADIEFAAKQVAS